MMLRMLLFLVFGTTIWAAAHLYVGRRIIRPWHKNDQTKKRAWIALWAGFALAPLVMASGRYLVDTAWFSPFRWLGFVHMGFFFLVFVLLVFRDLGLLVYRRWRLWRKDEPLSPERRAFLANTSGMGVVGTAGALTGWGLVEAFQDPELIEVDVPIAGLPPELDGYRIVQISDIHIGPSLKGDFLRAVVDRVNALDADVVAVTGDLIDGYVAELQPHVASLGDLRATDGVFFCTGNHEYYWNAEEWIEEVRRLGLTVLLNEHRLIERQGARLLLGGCTDIHADRLLPAHASDPGAAKRDAPAHDVSVLLAHQPRSIYAAAEAGFDLQISGHTHGGQFFPVNFFVHFAQPYVAGLEKHEDTWIYVNRGTGWWGPPMRSAVPGEITLLRLVQA